MGIDGLTKFVHEKAPDAIEESPLEGFMNRVIAVDASLSIYQFMVAIRDTESFGNLTNAAGEATSHIAGMLSRALRILELGMKPVYVFDGKPPTLKSGELAKRKDRKAMAEEGLAEAKESGDVTMIRKMAGRTVKVTKQHNEDVKKLLRLMGIPVVEAPGEAEAQCAAIAKAGLAYATATEDADALCFGTPLLMRRLTFASQDSKGKKPTLMIISLEKILQGLDLTMDSFIDFCILCGCDYCDTIRGIGPSSAYKLVKQHGSLEKVLENLDTEKHPVPENFPYKDARKFFTDPDILLKEDIPEFVWTDADEEGLRAFLVEEQQFGVQRVENAIVRLKKARKIGAQTRLDNFFRYQPSEAPKTVKAENKRQSQETKGNAKKKARR